MRTDFVFMCGFYQSGLIDCLRPNGFNGFADRINKEDKKTHFEESKITASRLILEKANELFGKSLLEEMISQLRLLTSDEQHQQKISNKVKAFYVGFWTRFLFSCLIDADRINSADFENPRNKEFRSNSLVNWSIPINRAESFFLELAIKDDIDVIRCDISSRCKEKAIQAQGIYSLSVPTGGGKTYASLRYALHHAKHHQLDRIIYVIPYTSIIEQNAEQIRRVIEREEDSTPWVFEHHSNLEPEQQTWHSKLVSESWARQ